MNQNNSGENNKKILSKAGDQKAPFSIATTPR